MDRAQLGDELLKDVKVISFILVFKLNLPSFRGIAKRLPPWHVNGINTYYLKDFGNLLANFLEGVNGY